MGALTQTFGFNELDRSLTCSGILVFLSIADLVEACFAAKGIIDDTHPRATERYTLLSYAMAKAGFNSYTLLAQDVRKFIWSIGDQLGVQLPNQEGTQAINDSVAGLVRDELQPPIPLWPFKPDDALNMDTKVSERSPWWKRIWQPISK
jgi:hypothetical protein